MNKDTSGKSLKAGVWYTVSNFLTRGIAFITTPIFTRVLTTSEYGQYSNFVTWQSLLSILVTLELYSSIARAKFDFEKEIDRYVSTITLTGTLFTMLCYGVTVLFMPFFSELFSLKPAYIHIMFCYLLTAPALPNLQAQTRVLYKYKVTIALSVASTVAAPLVALFMIYLSEDKLFGRIFGQELVLMVINSCIYIYILYRGRGFHIKYSKYALAYAIPLIPHMLAGNLLGNFDRIAIQKLCGSEDLAFYSLAYNCALLANILWSSFNQAMGPWLYENLASNSSEQIKKVSLYYISIFMLGAVGIMLLVPEVIWLLGGDGYAQAKYVMPPVIMGCCFQFAYSMYVNIEMYEKKTVMISIGTLAAAGLNILLNFWFIPIFGYIAAAYTTMFCYGVLLVFHYILVRRLQRHIVYNNRFNAVLLAVMCGITVIMELLYNFELVRRWLLAGYIAALLIGLYLARNVIIKLIRLLFY